MSIIDKLVREQLMRNAQVAETVCEAAIQTGQYGCVLIHKDNGAICGSVSEHVPYGEMYEFPSEDAYRKWFDRITE